MHSNYLFNKKETSCVVIKDIQKIAKGVSFHKEIIKKYVLQ